MVDDGGGKDDEVGELVRFLQQLPTLDLIAHINSSPYIPLKPKEAL